VERDAIAAAQPVGFVERLDRSGHVEQVHVRQHQDQHPARAARRNRSRRLRHEGDSTSRFGPDLDEERTDQAIACEAIRWAAYNRVMDARPTPSELFAKGLPAAVRARALAEPGLDECLRAALGAARARFPALALPAEEFLPYLGARASTAAAEGGWAAALGGLSVEDLYLACACARGEPAAIAALEESCLRGIAFAVARLPGGAAVVDDVAQRVRQHLLVAPAGAPPGIAGYSGRGQLRRFVRVIAVRAARRLLARAPQELAVEEEILEGLQATADPELDHVKRQYRAAFSAAFAESMRALGDADRMLLRQHLLDRLSLDELASLGRVHRATVARRLQRIRARIADETRQALLRRVPAGEADYESILRLIRSQLDLSIRAHLSP
jgi:RNA polymerase sigma-70 factor (ECF subfamily)